MKTKPKQSNDWHKFDSIGNVYAVRGAEQLRMQIFGINQQNVCNISLWSLKPFWSSMKIANSMFRSNFKRRCIIFGNASGYRWASHLQWTKLISMCHTQHDMQNGIKSRYLINGKFMSAALLNRRSSAPRAAENRKSVVVSESAVASI